MYIVHSPGSTTGICFQSTFSIIPHHFTRRRDFALSMMATGVGIGGIMYPLIINYFMEEYGYSGSILLNCGILLNGCVFSLLYKRFPDSFKNQEDYTTDLVKERSFLRPIIERLTISVSSLRSWRVLFHGIGSALFYVGLINAVMYIPYYMISQVRLTKIMRVRKHYKKTIVMG